jgi:glycine cleavage system H protein
MNTPEELRYSETHEWVRVAGDRATIGITDFAQDQLGDIVYLELPEVGRKLKAEDVFGVVESVKAVSDLYSPLDGEIVEVNEKLLDQPEILNSEPYGEGWMLVVRLENPSQVDGLMTAAQYLEHPEVAGQE